MNHTDANNTQGLFSVINGAVIKNLYLIEVDITAGRNVGALAGYAENSTIINCSSSGSVEGSTYVGGLVGFGDQVTIEGGYSSAAVRALEDFKNDGCAGGLVGGMEFSTIENSYSTGAVSGYENVGGIVGYMGFASVESSIIIKCFSTGSVTGTNNVGGLVGYSLNASVHSSFWDTEASGNISSDGGTGKSTEEMQIRSTFEDAGWDFDDTWSIEENDYPHLQWQERDDQESDMNGNDDSDDTSASGSNESSSSSSSSGCFISTL